MGRATIQTSKVLLPLISSITQDEAHNNHHKELMITAEALSPRTSSSNDTLVADAKLEGSKYANQVSSSHVKNILRLSSPDTDIQQLVKKAR